MRPIKFKAFSKVTEEVVDVYAIRFGRGGFPSEIQLRCGGEYFSASAFILMQYTGLNDATGKEIYEGYIVDYYRFHGKEFTPEPRKRRVISWGENVRCVGYNFRQTTNDGLAQWRVVGNIYENEDMVQ